ncbi:hypothetical protein [Streptomyces sp. NPDC017941]|uniref:hypothetical protein n=1 Tax=Streptomyces sp. NPDC017941 TaxID=3365018 RepID=UPI0037AF371C
MGQCERHARRVARPTLAAGNGCALLGTVNTNGGNDPGPGSASIIVGQVNGSGLPPGRWTVRRPTPQLRRRHRSTRMPH